MPLDQLPGTFFGPPDLVELVRHRAEHQPDEIAFVYLVDGENEQVHLTNQELDRQARGIAARLESLDLVGQRALLLYPAGLEFIAAFFGCLYAGVVAVPVYPPRRNRSLSRIQAVADDAEAQVALTTDVVLHRVEPLIDETPHLKQLTWLATSQVPEAMEDRWEKPDIHSDTLAFLQYTSGSTGTPKGVILNHANLMHNSALIAHAFEHTRSGLGVFWLPSYHDMGLIGGILQPLYVGRPNVLMSPMSFLQKPFRWLSAISRFGGTTSGGPNFAYDLCVRTITAEQRDTLDLSSWEVAFNGAEPVRDETVERFCETFGPCGFRRQAFYPCFGLAEATLIVSGGFARAEPVIRSFEAGALAAGQVVDGEPGDEGVRNLVGCGQTLPDQQIVIADPDTLAACPPGQIGEIWVRGPSVAQGYWRQPEVTEQTFRAHLSDTGEGPFLRTGDLGFLQDGELFVTGRIKDLIILRGVNLYPQDVERTVQQSNPRLRPDCGAAFSVEVGGTERLVVVQEVERRTRGDWSEVFEAVRRAVSAEHETPLEAIVLLKAGSIPKTSSGKIQRHACRNEYLAGTLDVVAQWTAGVVPGGPLASRARAAADARAGRRPGVPPGALGQRAAGAAEGGNGGPARRKTTADWVLEQVDLIAPDRVHNVTFDTPFAHLGLSSLERLELLASLEERFGGRFPDGILPRLDTFGLLVQAVERYLGKRPRPKPWRSAGAEVPPEQHHIERFPEVLALGERLHTLQSQGLASPYFQAAEGIAGDRIRLGGRELINFAGSDYLGMAGEPAVIRAAAEAAERYGASVSASRLLSGERALHTELEQAIARFIGAEDAVTLVGEHSTNETVIGHLLGPGDMILCDVLAHNSIVQGAILSGARRRVFPHNDWQAADKLLEQSRSHYRRVLIVTEGVCSTEGDIPDLPRFVEVKQRHHAMLMVDESHSLGTIGANGRGISEYASVDPADVDVWTGTLSKALGSCGGYVAGRKVLIEYLKHTAPGFVFSVALPPPNAAAALASLRLLGAEPDRVMRLRERAGLLLSRAREKGLNTGTSKDTPVVPVILGDPMHCLQVSRALLARGVHVQPILYPAVEESSARLRFCLTSRHTEEQVCHAIDITAEEVERVDPRYLAGSMPPVKIVAGPARPS